MTTKSTLFGASIPTPYDGSIPLPSGDAIFPGTLFSYQPAHPVYGTLGVAPVNGAAAKNAAWREAAVAMGLGAGDEASLHSAWVFGADTGADRFKVEVTTKGAVHGIVSQSLGNATTHAYVPIPDAIKTYMLNNSVVGGASGTDLAQPWNSIANHRFGHVVWLKETRVPRTDSGKVGPTVAFLNCAGLISFSQVANAPIWPTSGSENTGLSTTSSLLIGSASYPPLPMALDVPNMRWGTTRGFGVTEPANAAAMIANCGFGPLPGQTAAGFQQSAMSHVLYRWDVIDLSLSWPYETARAFRGIGGTDFSNTISDIFEVRNRLHGAFNRAIAPGGQFYGDAILTAPF